MKSLFTTRLLIIALGLLTLSLQGCVDTCEETRRWVYYEPVYQSLEDIRSSITVKEEVREIKSPGKLYYLNGYMLINQPGEGIHIIDDSDFSDPKYLSFLEIPGNFDLAGKGNYLYVDSYIDLVILDLSDINSINEVGRIENFFPDYNNYGFYLDEEKGLVTAWQEVEDFETFESNCDGSRYYGDWRLYRGGIAVDFAFAESSNSNISAPINPGLGGSLAKFTISKDHLFMIDQTDLHSVDITSPASPILQSKVDLGWGIETLFPYGDLLFVGSNIGLQIIDINAPASPVRLSTFSHVLSCDPVVVQGDYAYVTLRDGNTCRQGSNQLDVIDISNPSNPQLESSFALYNPGGLGIDDELLFICDGIAGLKIFDASDINTITSNPLKFYPDLLAIDVIPFNDVLMVIAEDGFYQYDYSDIENIQLLSKIDFTND